MHEGLTGNVPPRPGEAGHEPVAYRVGAHRDNDRNRRGRTLQGLSCRRRGCQDDINLELDQFSGKGWKLVDVSLSIPVLDREVLSFDVTELLEALPKGVVQFAFA